MPLHAKHLHWVPQLDVLSLDTSPCCSPSSLLLLFPLWLLMLVPILCFSFSWCLRDEGHTFDTFLKMSPFNTYVCSSIPSDHPWWCWVPLLYRYCCSWQHLFGIICHWEKSHHWCTIDHSWLRGFGRICFWRKCLPQSKDLAPTFGIDSWFGTIQTSHRQNHSCRRLHSSKALLRLLEASRHQVLKGIYWRMCIFGLDAHVLEEILPPKGIQGTRMLWH